MPLAHNIKTNYAVFILILAFLLILTRLIVLLPTFDPLTPRVFRVGIIPINDGADWIDRAQYILEGKKISMRPLFSAFLSIFIFIFGLNMPILISVIITINVVAVLSAFHILKDIRNSVFILLILSFFSLWRISSLADILTENLAVPFLIVAFAFIIRGLISMSYAHLIPGFAFIGVAQAIRPWDSFTLVILPLLPVVYSGFKKKNIILSVILLSVIMLGFSFDYTTSKLFSTSEKADIDRANYIYGQMSGARGYGYWLLNPEIKKSTLRYMAGIEDASSVKKVIYGQAFGKFKEDPQRYIKGTRDAIKRHFTTRVNVLFRNCMMRPGLFLLFFIFYLFVLFDNPKSILPSFSKKPALWAYPAGIIALVLFIWKQLLFWKVFVPLGFICMFFFMDKRQTSFMLLYISAIFLTIFVLGPVGSGRMWMSQELVIFYLTAISVGTLFLGTPKINTNTSRSDFDFSKKLSLRYGLTSFLSLIVFLIVLPLGARQIYTPKGKDISGDISSIEIAKALKINSRIIPQLTLEQNIFLWPLPTFEKINGAWVWWKIRYRPLKAFYLEPGEGLDKTVWQFSKWHLQLEDFPRVAYDDRNPIIFPYTDKEKLSRFTDHEIIVVGTLIGRKRIIYNHQGFKIIARFIGYPDSDGKIRWIAVGDL